MPRKETHIVLRGGLDLVSSPLVVQPGRLWTVVNYEPSEGGYRRIRGYERFDGRPRPSQQAYWVQARAKAAGDGDPQIPFNVYGATSRAVARVVGVYPDKLVVSSWQSSLRFADGERLENGPATESYGTAKGAPRKEAAASVADDLAFRKLAADDFRAAIQAVPGSGPVRGVWWFKEKLYAVRNNPAGTAAAMWRAESDGWDEMDIGARLAFDGGTVEPAEGLTVTGATSGAQAVLGYLELRSGSWTANNAAGYLWLDTPVGTFQDNEELRVTRAGSTFKIAVAAGTARANTLPKDGQWRFVNHNFKAHDESREMLFCNGQGPARRWDGQAYAEISTGQAADVPKHIEIKDNKLALAYPGGSLVLSSTGDPFDYTASKGAAEIGTGQEITGLMGGVGEGNLLIMGEDRMQILYGQDSTDYVLRDQSQEQTGGSENTLQSVGMPIYMDNRGVRSIETTEKWGNFVIGTITGEIQPWLDAQRDKHNPPVMSMRIRSADQYRVWFQSGVCLVVYMGRKKPETSFVDYGLAGNVRIIPRCTVSAEDSEGIERTFFGADDGFVYEVDAGRSFDGRSINAYSRMPLTHVGYPSMEKRFHKVDCYLECESSINLKMTALYNDGSNPDGPVENQNVLGGGGLWDESLWDDFYWDSPLNGYTEYRLRGMGRNLSILLASDTDREPPHTLNGMTLHWSPRRRGR